MSGHSGFRIHYQNPRHSVPAADVYEGYDLVSAFYDYLPAAACATIEVGDYVLDMSGLILINWVRECLPLAEQIRSDGADRSDYLRQFLPDLPSGAKAWFWIVADIPISAPILVFAVVGDRVLVYTRTDANVSGPRLILSDADKEAPTSVLRDAFLAEIRGFLTKYLDDVVAAFRFLETDELYLQYRERIAALV